MLLVRLPCGMIGFHKNISNPPILHIVRICFGNMSIDFGICSETFSTFACNLFLYSRIFHTFPVSAVWGLALGSQHCGAGIHLVPVPTSPGGPGVHLAGRLDSVGQTSGRSICWLDLPLQQYSQFVIFGVFNFAGTFE